MVRYSKERLPDEMPPIGHRGEGRDRVDLLRADDEADVLLVGYGQFAGMALDVARRLASEGVRCTVADSLWCVPVSPELVLLAGRHKLVVSLEDNLVTGGLGQRLRGVLDDTRVPVGVMALGLPQRFLSQGSRDEVLAAVGLTDKAVARLVLERVVAGHSTTPAGLQTA